MDRKHEGEIESESKANSKQVNPKEKVKSSEFKSNERSKERIHSDDMPDAK